MTQYLATCLNCGGMVSQLEQKSTVERCDACKGDDVAQLQTPEAKQQVRRGMIKT